MYVHVHVRTHARAYTVAHKWWSEEHLWGLVLSFHVWVLGMECRSSDLAASTLTCGPSCWLSASLSYLGRLFIA